MIAGAIILRTIDQIMVNIDRPILEINVLPPQTQHLANATASTEHYSKQRIPSAILCAVGDVKDYEINFCRPAPRIPMFSVFARMSDRWG